MNYGACAGTAGELMGVWFSYGDMLDGKAAICRFHLLHEITDQNDNIASTFVEFRFAKRACELREQAEGNARLGEHLAETETYARVALKAQAQSRTALEALQSCISLGSNPCA